MSAGRYKGFGFVDAIIALAIFVSVFTALMYFYRSSIEADYISDEVLKGTYYLEAIKNQLQSNHEYGELDSLCNGTVYVNNDELIDDRVFYGDILEETDNVPHTSNYVSITAERKEDDKPIRFELKYKFGGGCIYCVFYKGNYKKS